MALRIVSGITNFLGVALGVLILCGPSHGLIGYIDFSDTMNGLRDSEKSTKCFPNQEVGS